MAHSMVYKDIAVGNESTFGNSIAFITAANRLHVKTVTLNLNNNKEMVDDTMNTPKGRDRMVIVKKEVDGDITGYVTPRVIHHMIELANGELAATSSVGTSAVLYTYNQNISGSMISKTIGIDRNNSQEVFNGVRGSALEITGSDSRLEFTLSAIAKTQSDVGVSLPDITGETIKAAVFHDVVITAHPGASYGTQLTTVLASEWSIKYENGLEGSFLSGSPDIARSDPKVPMVTGKFKIFHEGASFVTLQHGCSEAYLRFDITFNSCKGLIAGVTPYLLRIDVPRTEMKSNVRDFEAGEYSMEEVEFEGKYDLGTSALWVVTQTAGANIS